MSFEILNVDMALQISNKILFEEYFGDALRTFNKSMIYEYNFCACIIL